MLSDGLSAADWLNENHLGRLGTVGFCMGGNYVLAMASERDHLSTVCFYGFPGRPIHFTQDELSPTPIDLVPRIRGPVIGFWGDQDEGAGMANVNRFATAMREHGHDFELHVYQGVGHGFMAASQLEPGGLAYEDACDGWTRTVNFLRHSLS
jgi:carboxymethylenebutenolidase